MAEHKKTTEADQKARLKKVLKRLHVDRKTLAEELDTTLGYVNQVLSGRNSISAGFREKLSKHYSKINIEWIMTGDGEMFHAVDIPPGMLDPQVMEAEVEYRSGSEGLLEGVLRRLAAVEEELRGLRALEGRVSALEEKKDET